MLVKQRRSNCICIEARTAFFIYTISFSMQYYVDVDFRVTLIGIAYTK